jgi:hypothetical protein
VCGDGADTGDFVGRNGDAEAGAADEEGAVSFSLGYEGGSIYGDVCGMEVSYYLFAYGA